MMGTRSQTGPKGLSKGFSLGKATRNSDAAGMRVRPSIKGGKTYDENQAGLRANELDRPIGYKKDTHRIKWKGIRDDDDLTGGIPVYEKTRDSRPIPAIYKELRQKLDKAIKDGGKTTPLNNGHGDHYAEFSHLVAGSLGGPNEIVNAPPGSVGQNTEWLAIESGLKTLSKNNIHSGQKDAAVRFKTTGYIHDKGPLEGTIKAARFKIYIGKNKVFDHLTDGTRGNIDKEEFDGLKKSVAELSSNPLTLNPSHSKNGGTNNNVKGLGKERFNGRAMLINNGTAKSSSIHPAFTKDKIVSRKRKLGA